MKSPVAISGGSADRTPPPPPVEFFVVLPDGSCIPSTPDACRIVMKQARSETRKQARLKRLEKAAELQCAMEDRAAARRLAQELAEAHQASLRWAARFRARVRPDDVGSKTSSIRKRSVSHGSAISSRPIASARPASSWATDDLGFRGVIWQQSYVGRSSSRFRRGAARAHWDYIVRDEAVLLDADGEPVIITNMGADWTEVGAAWQAVEDATTRVNGKIQLRAIAPFDSDMSETEMIEALSHFCRNVLDPLSLPYSAAIHRPPATGDARNFHPHIIFGLRPMRRIEPFCWDIADEVCGELDGRDGVQMLRHLWAHSMSEAAERAQSNRRYTGLGYGARGLDLEAGEHLGEARAAIIARGGHVWAHERNRIKNERNQLRRAIRDADRKIEALTKVQEAAIERSLRTPTSRTGRVVRAAPSVEPALRNRPSHAAQTDRGRRLERQRTPDRQPAAQASLPNELRTPLMPACQPQAGAALEPASPSDRRGLRDISATTVPAKPMGAGAAPSPAMTRLSASRRPDEAKDFSRRPDPVDAPIMLTGAGSVIGRGARQVADAVEPARRRSAAMVGQARGIEDDILHRLAQAHTRRDRERAARERRNRQMVLAEVPTLGDRPRLDLMAAFPALPAAIIPEAAAAADAERLRLLARIDAYVADYGGGSALDVTTAALKVIGVDEAWLGRPWVQQGLAALRTRQQALVDRMIEDADRRPLDYAKAGTRFWPRDLDADLLRRLDRWAADPGFQRDVFEVERRIYEAHQARDAALRQDGTSAKRPGGIGSEAMDTGMRFADGFGGWRDTPPPTFVQRAVSPRIAPFDPATGAPHPSLLQLLHQCGTRPRTVAFASDGKLMALDDAAKPVDLTLQLWRDDPRVEALVVETVSASRAAGMLVWPGQYRDAILALADKPAPRRGSHRRRRPPPQQGRDR
jgi:hypothetical protein